jgi:hypothetical protein
MIQIQFTYVCYIEPVRTVCHNTVLRSWKLGADRWSEFGHRGFFALPYEQSAGHQSV